MDKRRNIGDDIISSRCKNNKIKNSNLAAYKKKEVT